MYVHITVSKKLFVINANNTVVQYLNCTILFIVDSFVPNRSVIYATHAHFDVRDVKICQNSLIIA